MNKKVERILFALPGNEILADKLRTLHTALRGEAIIRTFPDGEVYVRIQSEVRNKDVILVCTFHRPDSVLLPLYFMAQTARDLGARSVTLVAPYLAYMRQDIRFNSGEGITSQYFGKLVSGMADHMITVDPHLHRIKDLSDIYTIPCKTLHAGDHIADWIVKNVPDPVLIGPDVESKQWLAEVSKRTGAPYIVLHKTRYSDKEVVVEMPDVRPYLDHTPVLIDDIISTAETMQEVVKKALTSGMKPPVCIGIHALFAENAYRELLSSGVKNVVTCNTIPHESNGIDVTDLIMEGISSVLK